MSTIRLLDEATINRIAAGEVIDRPASVVKELVENSLDAGATAIRIEIEQGGIKSIRITDNGQGMSADNLKLAPVRHATSKIQAFDDIYSAFTFGFRGEALASICHIARVFLMSCVQGQEAYAVEVLDTEISDPVKTAHPPGTTIHVKDLFGHLPVRQKFLKNPATEFSYIYEWIIQFALINPAVDFVLTHNSVEMLNTTGISNQLDLLALIYDPSLRGQMLPVDSELAMGHVTGYISKPTLTFANRSRQFIAVNRRTIRNSLLQRVVNQVYQDLIPQRRFPLVLLNIDMHQDLLDVNIHPQKTDVKFLDGSHLFSELSHALKAAVQFEGDVVQTEYMAPSESLPNRVHTFVSRPESVAAYRGQVQAEHWAPLFNLDTITASGTQPFEYVQVFDTYIVLKTQLALYILDQHAVHERILYEKLKVPLKNTQSQSLLVSEVMTLTPAQYAVFETHQAKLQSLGFELEAFGGLQIIIRAIPQQLHPPSSIELVSCLLDALGDDTLSLQSKSEQERLQTMACKAAIKAGKRMSELELRELLREFLDTPANFTCPHGRPVYIRFEKSDLEKLFLRT